MMRFVDSVASSFFYGFSSGFLDVAIAVKLKIEMKEMGFLFISRRL